jgi:hypothetical protein
MQQCRLEASQDCYSINANDNADLTAELSVRIDDDLTMLHREDQKLAMSGLNQVCLAITMVV